MQCVSAAELELIAEPFALQNAPAPLDRILTNRNLWACDPMYFTLGFTYYLYIGCLPTYLAKRRGVSRHRLAHYAALAMCLLVSVEGH